MPSRGPRDPMLDTPDPVEDTLADEGDTGMEPG